MDWGKPQFFTNLPRHGVSRMLAFFHVATRRKPQLGILVINQQYALIVHNGEVRDKMLRGVAGFAVRKSGAPESTQASASLRCSSSSASRGLIDSNSLRIAARISAAL